MLTPVRILANHGPMLIELAQWQGQLVVVKRLKDSFNFDMLEERLLREAAVAQKLSHQNIIPLLAIQEKALIYAYEKGSSLAEVIDKGLPNLEQALKILSDILSALAYAHDKGVIHCDVKPSNIIIAPDGTALITDFGFAKDLDLASITLQGTMLGTPNYMAPEQFKGKRTDRRSDIYAVGAVLYHMLTGFPPYGRNVIRFLMGDKSVALDTSPFKDSPVLEIVCKALSYEPQERYDSAAQMLEQVEKEKEKLLLVNQ